MKQIGRTNTGGVILEATEKEYQAFLYLDKVAKGATLSGYMDYSFNEHLDADILPTLEAVAEWMAIKDRANRLRNLANEIDTAIGSKS